MFQNLAEKLRRVTREREIEFKSYDEVADEEIVDNDTPDIEPDEQITEEKSSAIRSDSENIELKVVRPESFAEVSAIADYLLSGCTVVLNVEALERAMTLRMLDFLNGVTYATDGEIKKVAQTTYIVTTRNVDVTDAD